MTMLWLHRGGREANPVMDFFLDLGPAAFLAQKCLVVGFWLILLVVHKNFRFAKIGLYAALAVYALLLIVHFGIVTLGVEPPPEPSRATATDEVWQSWPARSIDGRAETLASRRPAPYSIEQTTDQ
jgi:hypothetical protein